MIALKLSMKPYIRIVIALLVCGVSANAAPLVPKKRIAVTLDDLPGWVPVAEKIAEKNLNTIATTLKKEKVPTTGFVIGALASRTEDAKKSLVTWAKAGFPLANHTWEHRPYSNFPTDQFWKGVKQTEEEVLKPLREKYGPWPLAFRFPMLNQGEGIEQEKAANQYLDDTDTLLAHVSIDTSDWAFAREYDEQRKKKKTKNLERIEELYLEHVLDCVEYAEEASSIVYSKQISHILLLHANTLNAKMIGKVISGIRKRGYQFISFSEAMKDPVYEPYQHKIPYQPLGEHFLWQVAQLTGKKLPIPDRSAYAFYEEYWAKRLKRELK